MARKAAILERGTRAALDDAIVLHTRPKRVDTVLIVLIALAAVGLFAVLFLQTHTTPSVTEASSQSPSGVTGAAGAGDRGVTTTTPAASVSPYAYSWACPTRNVTDPFTGEDLQVYCEGYGAGQYRSFSPTPAPTTTAAAATAAATAGATPGYTPDPGHTYGPSSGLITPAPGWCASIAGRMVLGLKPYGPYQALCTGLPTPTPTS